jgi:hypothetical protein
MMQGEWKLKQGPMIKGIFTEAVGLLGGAEEWEKTVAQTKLDMKRQIMATRPKLTGEV